MRDGVRTLRRTCAIVIFAACAPDGSRQMPPDGGAAVDPAAAGVFSELPRWHVDPEPIQTIGVAAGPPALQFHRISSVTRLRGGGVAVVDRGSAEIRVFDARGSLLASFGREGEGPGEFLRPETLGMRGDSLLIFDVGLTRMSVIHPTDGFIRTEPVPPEGRPVGLAGGSGVWHVFNRTSRPPGPSASSPTRFTVSRTSLEDGTSSVVAEMEGKRWTAEESDGMVRLTPVDGTYNPVFVASEGRLWAIDGDGLTGRVFDAGETSFDLRPEMAGEDVGRSASAPLRVADAVADVDGGIWIRVVDDGPTGDTNWIAVNDRGEPIARVRLPGRFHPLSIGENEIRGVWRDDLDVEIVRIYRLERTTRSVDAPAVSATARPGDLLLTGGRWLDVETGKLRANTGILIRDGAFAAIGDVDPDAIGEGQLVELDPEHVILPGIIDLHAHYAVDLFGDGRVDETAAYPALFLANGVTSTFPAGEMDPEAMRDLRIAIDAGERPGPRIFNSGPYFGSWRRGWDDAAMTADSIRAEVDYWVEQGVRGFKAKGIRPEHLEALIDAAHAHGLTVTGHLDSGFRGTVNPRDAILMGIDRVEHFLGGDMMPSDRSAYASLEVFDDFDGPALRDIIDLYIARGVFFDATLSIYGYWGPHDPEMTEHWTDELRFLTPYMRELIEARPARPVLESFRRMSPIKRRTAKAFYDGGGRDLMTLGTDHPSWGRYWSGFGAHRELLALARAGIPTADVFRIASLNGARALGVDDRLGSISRGKLADLFVVRGNPLDDVRSARAVEYVVSRGHLFETSDLLASAVGTIGPIDASAEDAWRPER